MTFEEELRRNREVLTRISASNSIQLEELSEEDKRFIAKLMRVDEPEWGDLLNALRETDSELSAIAQLARETVKFAFEEAESDEPFRFSSRIQSVSASPYLGIENGVPFIRLIFKTANEKSIYSDQDLEDALGIGVAVVQSIARTAQSMVEKLGIPPERIEWGDEFGTRLALAEKYTKTLRRLYGQHRRLEGEQTSSPEDK